MARKDAEIARLEGIYARLLQGSGVELIRAKAHLVDAHTVSLGDRTVTAANIMSVPEVQAGLRSLHFSSPHLASPIP